MPVYVGVRDALVRSDCVGADAGCARMAAQPVQKVTRAEKTTGGVEKYFQVSARPTNCRKKNIQGSGPRAAGSFRDNSPKCHATAAANKKYTVAKSPNPL